MRVAFDRFIVDSATRQLLRDNCEVHLGPKAFEVLEALIERRPAVVTKADLHDLVWADTFVSDASLNVVVTEVRRALGDAAKDPRFIRTIHGVGYAFCGAAVDTPASPQAPPAPYSRTWLAWNEQTFPLVDGENVIGRDPRCSVWVDASGVSRRHARVSVAADSFTLEDLGSRNGTFLRGGKVTTPQPLQDGDVIRLGDVSIRFRVWSEERVPPTERLVPERRSPTRKRNT
jgi:DNA-binding winged helix-turn-helix (wHTH) protein